VVGGRKKGAGGRKRRRDKGSRITDHGSRNYYVEISGSRIITLSSIYIRVLRGKKKNIFIFNEK